MECTKMLDIDSLGDILEEIYHTIYEGGGSLFGVCVIRLKNILSMLVSAGMLTNITKKRTEAFFKNVAIENFEIISRETNDVVLNNVEVHEQDSFALVDYIVLITEALRNDPIMKKLLCGKENYEGVKATLNTYGERRFRFFKEDNWIDVSMQAEKVFFTKRDEKSIHLYYKNFGTKKTLEHGPSEVLLAKEDLLDGRIYALLDRTIYVQEALGYIIRISNIGCEKCTYSRMQGRILGQLDDGSLVYIVEDNLVCLDPNRNKRIITTNVSWGWTYISEKEVYWKSRFRKQDVKSVAYHMNNVAIAQISECLEVEKVCKEILWKGLLLTLYDFCGMEFHNKIGNRIRFVDFFDHPPFPFVMKEIGLRLSELEKYCYKEEINKNEGYIEAMSYLIALEKEELDERDTFEALEYLLENVKDNPYERMADDTGTLLLDGLSFILGDINLLEDIPKTDENSKDMFLFTNEELVKRINEKIAEIESVQEKG